MRSIFVSVVGYLFLLVICSLSLVISAVALVVCYPFDPKRRVVHNITRSMVYIFFFLFRWMWQYELSGEENVDPHKKYVILLNHNAMMDVPMLYLLPLDFRWVSKRQVFMIPFFGQLLVLHGDIPIERGNPAKAMKLVMQRGLRWLGRGVSISIFPEGTRSKTGEIGRFKSGAFRLAREAQVEILPVVLDGTGKLLSKNGMLSPTGVIKIKALPPVSVERVVNSDIKELMDEVRTSMVDALAELRENK